MPQLNTQSKVGETLSALRRVSSKTVLAGYARYAIPTEGALGVAMADIQKLGKQLGRDHALALALWKTGIYEARLLCAYVDEPEKVTPAQMDAWAGDFDNWGVCDTLCIALWDRTPHAFKKIRQWSTHRAEFVKRAAFALLAGAALHDKTSGDEQFLRCLPLIAKASGDERNFVRKSVNWALRAVGQRNLRMHQEALDLAKKLAASDAATARWIGKDALRQLMSPASQKRVKSREKRAVQ